MFTPSREALSEEIRISSEKSDGLLSITNDANKLVFLNEIHFLTFNGTRVFSPLSYLIFKL